MRRIAMISALVLLITGCDDFLTTPPADQYTQANFWKNEEEVEAGLTGVYEVLRGYSSDLIFHGDVLTPNAVKFDDPGGWRSIARGEALTTNVLFGSAWNSDYKGIGRANTVLANVDNADLASDVSDKIKGEAKFLRAFFYADLINKFGGVPLITDQPNPSQGDQSRAEESDVLSQVLNDLSDAASLLPEDNDPGRATKGAALAFKARILLYHNKWKEAAETAKKVIDLAKYSLFPDYGGLFKVQNEHNQEVIWDIEFELPRFTNNFVDQATVHADPAPLKGLIDAYLMKDGKPASESSLYEPSDPYKNRDPRLYQTVRLLGSMFNGKVTKQSDVPETFIGAKKWTPYSDSSHMTEVTAGLSAINPIVIRYAGVLLIYAEAENEAVGPVQSVYDAIN
ncbi:MAG TPA: RagB/SusD family nutrient uptake outer membrane protein, partial [Chitinophagaceae bacterium]|nr:RagB/SusD family nutrient uptake outer membrane protein [Chitinophagaceae bacterium]